MTRKKSIQEDEMHSIIIYSTRTGNTKKVAQAIHKEFKDFELVNLDEFDVEKIDCYDQYLIGFWVDKGMPDKKSLSLIQAISHKKVGYFGTLGAYPNGDHGNNVIRRTDEQLQKNNNEILCRFLCQGKIDPNLQKRMAGVSPRDPHYPTPERIQMWSEATLHPDAQDLRQARAVFRKHCL